MTILSFHSQRWFVKITKMPSHFVQTTIVLSLGLLGQTLSTDWCFGNKFLAQNRDILSYIEMRIFGRSSYFPSRSRLGFIFKVFGDAVQVMRLFGGHLLRSRRRVYRRTVCTVPNFFSVNVTAAQNVQYNAVPGHTRLFGW